MVLLLGAIVAGVLTAASPCVLPVLPVLLGGGMLAADVAVLVTSLAAEPVARCWRASRWGPCSPRAARCTPTRWPPRYRRPRRGARCCSSATSAARAAAPAGGDPHGAVRRLTGLLFVVVGVGILLGADTAVEMWAVEHVSLTGLWTFDQRFLPGR